MKLVINTCYGGFSLSPQAVERLAELQGRKCYHFTCDYKTSRYTRVPTPISNDNHMYYQFDITEVTDTSWSDGHHLTSRPDDREDPLLIQVVEELGSKKASGVCAELEVREIPDGVNYEIKDYDGVESIHEVHRSW